MTSASELFHNRRSRLGRSNPEIGFHSAFEHHHNSGSRRHHHQHHHTISNHYAATNGTGGTSNVGRRDPSPGDILRRPPFSRLPHSGSSQPGRGIWPDDGGTQLISGNYESSEDDTALRNRSSFMGSERLPGAVLLARERLLQRLRGVSISGNRRSNRVPTPRRNFTLEDDFRLVDAGDWETEISRNWGSGTGSSGDSPWRSSKRPPGLTQEALEQLPIEIFSMLRSDDAAEESRVLQECSICLDSFLEGDKLICLPCGHRFHFGCLDPWIRTCGDCPYCRAPIVIPNSRSG